MPSGRMPLASAHHDQAHHPQQQQQQHYHHTSSSAQYPGKVVSRSAGTSAAPVVVDPQLQLESSSLHSSHALATLPQGYQALLPRSQSITTIDGGEGPTLRNQTHIHLRNSGLTGAAEVLNSTHAHNNPHTYHNRQQQSLQQQQQHHHLHLQGPILHGQQQQRQPPFYETENPFLNRPPNIQHEPDDPYSGIQFLQQDLEQRQDAFLQQQHVFRQDDLFRQQQQPSHLYPHQQHAHHVAQSLIRTPLHPMPPHPLQPQHSGQQRLSPESDLVGNGSGMVEGSTGRQVLLPNGSVSSPSPDAESVPSASDSSGPVSTTSRGYCNGIDYVPSTSTGATPQKGGDGKFPCQSCNRSYLHAKHLKRHMLRHTGDRPYICGLCSDTFSRSDILKRHFTKCSARRGNPQGVSHLTLTHAQQKKRAAEEKAAAAAAAGAIAGGGAGLGAGTGAGEGKRGSGKACDNCVKLKVRCDVGNPCSRCSTRGNLCTYTKNNVQPRGNSTDIDSSCPLPTNFIGGRNSIKDELVGYGDGFNFPPPHHPNAHMTQHGQQQAMGINPQRLDQIPVSSSSLVSSLPLNDILHSRLLFTPGTTNPGDVADLHTDVALGVGMGGWPGVVGAPYVDSSCFPPFLPLDGLLNEPIGDGIDMLFSFHRNPAHQPRTTWSPEADTAVLQPTRLTKLQEKCERLIAFCFPEQCADLPMSSQSQQRDYSTDDLKAWITPNHLEHFVGLFFSNFQIHFPIIHVPTFDIRRMHDGLLSALVCIGAVYSERGIVISQVRRLSGCVFTAMIHRIHSGADRSMVELEDIQAFLLLHIILTWHGDATQREMARTRFGIVVDLAHRINLFKALDVHQLRAECERSGKAYYRTVQDVEFHPEGSVSWSWSSWLMQERRTRCALTCYLFTTALLCYFNTPPGIKTTDVQLTLPADDAAWEAKEGEICASALGIYGDARTRRVNPNGTQLQTQMRFLEAMNLLMTPEKPFPPCRTNASSKFLLVHALHVQIWLYHMQSTEPGHEWLSPSLWLGPKRPASQHESHDAPHHYSDVDVLVRALEKWKVVWDSDFQHQFPNPASRVGFSRDGSPFYFAGRLFLQHSDRRKFGFGPEGTPHNVKVMLSMLRQAKVMPDTDCKELGAVGSIDDKYGIEELTFDMKLLFKPIS